LRDETISMSLGHQTDDGSRPVHEHRKQAHDVPPSTLISSASGSVTAANWPLKVTSLPLVSIN
jgi:hypothetical protein